MVLKLNLAKHLSKFQGKNQKRFLFLPIDILKKGNQILKMSRSLRIHKQTILSWGDHVEESRMPSLGPSELLL